MKNAVFAVYRDVIHQLKQERRRLVALVAALLLLIIWKEVRRWACRNW